MLNCYFATGTGRCGTLLLARALGLGETTHCNHEFSVTTAHMKKAFFKEKPALLSGDLEGKLVPEISRWNGEGKSYGECSAHLYLLFPEIFRRYQYSCRFILLVRRPDAFVRSALARGFFSPDHPHGLEHVVPSRETGMGRRWSETTPLEKCSWYWAAVNGGVYRFFLSLPSSMWRIQRVEDIGLPALQELYEFLHFRNFDAVRPDLEELISRRHNASPGQNGTRDDLLNPYSSTIGLGPIETWTIAQRDAYERHVGPMRDALYGEESGKEPPGGNLSSLQGT